MKMYMLKFGFSGIKNIEKYIELDFYKKQVDNQFDPADYKVKAVYGENGAGKTAIVTAVKLLRDLILQPNMLADSRAQTLLSELINKRTETVSLYTDLYIDIPSFDKNTRKGSAAPQVYTYEISLKRGADLFYYIDHERLTAKRASYSRAVSRVLAEVSEGELVKLSSTGETAQKISRKTMNLLKQQSLVAALFRILDPSSPEDCSDPLMVYAFKLTVCALGINTYLDHDDSHEFYLFKKSINQILAAETKEDKWLSKLFGQISSYISVQAKYVPKDMLTDYEEKIRRLSSFIRLFKPSLRTINVDKKDTGSAYEVNLLFNYGSYTIDHEFESTGIKKLVKIYDSLDSAAAGGISFVDELDANINDVYFSRIIEFMLDYGEGQLCFTTHNVSPMDLLQKKQKGIVFLTQHNEVIPWTINGNYSPRTQYQKGMIEKIPFNIDATDFIGILGGN